MLSAMFGDKGDVTKYLTGEVLLVMGMSANEQALNDWTQHHYGKMMEAKHKK